MQKISIKKENKGFIPFEGEKTNALILGLKKDNPNLSDDALDRVKNEAIRVLSCCVDPKLDSAENTTSLAVGYVQSGKTLSFTILSALASDNGFKVIIYFAGTKNNLLTQTTDRLKKDLITGAKNRTWYKPFENPSKDDVDQMCRILKTDGSTILITVLKHHVQLGKLAEIFDAPAMKACLGKKGVLIIDDEADQASLNGYAYKNSKSEDWESDEFTTTYSSILSLRSHLPNHSYVQYTATPQGPLLINIMDLLSPKSHTVLTPGDDYTGGKTFFIDRPGLILTIPDKEVYNSKERDLKYCPKSLIDALQVHLMNVAIVVQLMHKESFLSMMVHADKEQDASRKFHKWIEALISEWTDTFDLDENDVAYIAMKESFNDIYSEVIRECVAQGESVPSFEESFKELKTIIADTDLELVISGKNRNSKKGNSSIDWDIYPSYILVGADMLNRGFTVKNLAVTYMPRYSLGKSNADTIQQRCRFFGYKKNYLNFCRVYLPMSSQIEYKEYVKDEEEMRQWLLNNSDLACVERQLLQTELMRPTRKNILSKDIVATKLSGWRQMNALLTAKENKDYIENVFLKKYASKFMLYDPQYGTDDRDHRYLKLPISEIEEFLTNFKVRNVQDSLRKQATIRYINYLEMQMPSLKYAYIIQMAYKSKGRKRSLDQNGKINNLHSGRSTKGDDVYPGDKKILFNESFTIQLHHVHIENSTKNLYTLAIYYPEKFAAQYIGGGNRKR